jgi:hypothetical protein
MTMIDNDCQTLRLGQGEHACMRISIVGTVVVVVDGCSLSSGN